jgi:uncharacterized protein (TIGR03437 family)
MIGLGATQDPTAFVTDRQFAGAFPIRAPITARVGGEPARVIFAGLTTPGSYLVRIEIPAALEPGNRPIEVSLGTSPADEGEDVIAAVAQNRKSRRGSDPEWQLRIGSHRDVDF